ncbi:MAG: flavin reductase, partial [Lachnospiraceae bacterium]|nr:flavin reductase [Lachnospiraceae bacterium]
EWMLITTEHLGKSNTMTASWGGMGVMWNKNVVYIFVRESRYTREMLDAADTFSLSFMGEGSRGTLKYLGAVSGRNEDKIHNARLDVSYHQGVPFIDESDAVIICKKLSKHTLTEDGFCDPSIAENFYKDGDYHNMYIGEITELMAR